MIFKIILAPLFYFIYFYVLSIQPFIYLGLITYLVIMFLITHIKKDMYIGNLTWQGGVLLLTLYSFCAQIPWAVTTRKILMSSLIFLWAISRSIYLYLRYQKRADPSFLKWQESWGRLHFLATFVWVVILQGTLMLVMSFPSVMVNQSDTGYQLNQLDIIGLIIWLVGFSFQTVGDYQLYRFLKNPNNSEKIMDQGLWKYSRHPDFLGEIAMWWGIYMITLSCFDGFWTIIAPLTITILLRFVTGIPCAERIFKNNPDYEAYKKRTNMLIPGFLYTSNNRSLFRILRKC